MKTKFLFSLIISFLSLGLFANADSYLVEEFQKTFTTHYKEGRCGENILNLLQRAQNKGITIDNANILEISNEGFSLFGLINAEFARQSNREPAEKNWYHHVVLEQNGFIIDFDFGNSPVVTTVQEYFEKMFLNDKKTSYGHYIGRKEKLENYEILIRPALETINARQSHQSESSLKKLKLKDYL